MMAGNLPPLNWFRVFETAARCLSFTAAADELGLTQSAVSQQIKALETRLGAPLFVRRARGLTLTDEARKLLPMVTASLEQLNAAAHLFAPQPSQALITVAASVSISQWVIAPKLAAFTMRFPQVRIRFVGTIWADEFQNRAADVEIRFGPARAFSKSARRLPDHLIAVAHPDCDLNTAALVETVGTTQGWRDWQRASGTLTNRKPALFVDSYGLALTLAEQGSTVALVSSIIARPSILAGRINRIGDTQINGAEGYYLTFDGAKPNARAFTDWFLDQICDD
jgi:LysR family glycine cleavage system transcriptional activator